MLKKRRHAIPNNRQTRQQTALKPPLRYFYHHFYAIKSCLSRFAQTPSSSLLTLLAIGITLTLPTLLYLLSQNTQIFTKTLENGAQISLYLQKDISEDDTRSLTNQLKQNPIIQSISYIPAEEGLKNFEESMQYKGIADHLPTNPLPDVLELKFHPKTNPDTISQLYGALKSNPNIENVQLDLAWVKKLSGILQMLKILSISLAILFGWVVILVIGNTIQLLKQQHQQEMNVLNLLGAAPSFIKRPFLYTGLCYGLGGGLIAYAITAILLTELNGPVHHLAELYNSDYSLNKFTVQTALILLGSSVLLGLAGAFMATRRTLN